MRLDWHGNQIPAVVRGRRIHRHRAVVAEDRSAAAVLLAQGPPRAWQRSLDAAVAGACEGLEARAGAEETLAEAAARVRSCARSLVDDGVIQVHAVAIAIEEEGKARLATAGSCRAYLDRGGEHRRLSSKSSSKGLADAYAFPTSEERLAPGDVVVLGPSHIFNVTGIAMLARLLHKGDEVDAQRVVRGLLSLCRAQETGGAAVALCVG